jgi:valyl-tRNA synthetase
LQKKQFPKGIPACGTDALRIALVAGTTQARDLNLDLTKISTYTNFCNKLWNIARFATFHFDRLGFEPGAVAGAGAGASESACAVVPGPHWPLADRWIASRLGTACADADAALSAYDFPRAVRAVTDFWLHDLSDVYIELIKPQLRASDGHEELQRQRAVAATLHVVVNGGLRLLAPLMPYISETLYAHLPSVAATAPLTAHGSCPDSICVQAYPLECVEWIDATAEAEMAQLAEVARAIRSIPLKQLNSAAKIRAHVAVTSAAGVSGGNGGDLLAGGLPLVATLSKAASVAVLGPDQHPPQNCIVCSCGAQVRRLALNTIAEQKPNKSPRFACCSLSLHSA